MKKCFHHSERDPAGNCRYCGRSLCVECSSEGRDNLHCKDENDCLDYQNEESEATPVPVIPNAYSLLDTYVQRLSDVQDELGEIEKLFEESADRIRELRNEEDVSNQGAEESDRQRITGFRGFHLAHEGVSLLNLISIGIAYLESSQELETEEQVEKVEKAKEYVKEVSSLFHKTLEKMTSYESMNAQAIVKAIAAKISKP